MLLLIAYFKTDVGLNAKDFDIVLAAIKPKTIQKKSMMRPTVPLP
jgi:hypothetical protein